MKIEYSCAGIILNKNRVTVVYQKSTDSWVLPKGHIKEGESKEETARREILEETGIKELQFIKELGSYERPTRKSSEIKKHITVLLFKTKEDKLEPADQENPEAKWIEIGKVANLLTYKEDKEFFLKIKKQL